MKYLLCLIGIHDYGDWDPQFTHGLLADLARTFMRQRRFCKRCNKIQYRESL